MGMFANAAMAVPGEPSLIVRTTRARPPPYRHSPVVKFLGFGFNAAAAGPSPCPVLPWHDAQFTE